MPFASASGRARTSSDRSSVSPALPTAVSIPSPKSRVSGDSVTVPFCATSSVAGAVRVAVPASWRRLSVARVAVRPVPYGRARLPLASSSVPFAMRPSSATSISSGLSWVAVSARLAMSRPATARPVPLTVPSAIGTPVASVTRRSAVKSSMRVPAMATLLARAVIAASCRLPSPDRRMSASMAPVASVRARAATGARSGVARVSCPMTGALPDWTRSPASWLGPRPMRRPEILRSLPARAMSPAMVSGSPPRLPPPFRLPLMSLPSMRPSKPRESAETSRPPRLPSGMSAASERSIVRPAPLAEPRAVSGPDAAGSTTARSLIRASKPMSVRAVE